VIELGHEVDAPAGVGGEISKSGTQDINEIADKKAPTRGLDPQEVNGSLAFSEFGINHIIGGGTGAGGGAVAIATSVAVVDEVVAGHVVAADAAAAAPDDVVAFARAVDVAAGLALPLLLRRPSLLMPRHYQGQFLTALQLRRLKLSVQLQCCLATLRQQRRFLVSHWRRLLQYPLLRPRPRPLWKQ
jgi:hypothetical protein